MWRSAKVCLKVLQSPEDYGGVFGCAGDWGKVCLGYEVNKVFFQIHFQLCMSLESFEFLRSTAKMQSQLSLVS